VTIRNHGGFWQLLSLLHLWQWRRAGDGFADTRQLERQPQTISFYSCKNLKPFLLKIFESISKIVDHLTRFAGCRLSPLILLGIECFPILALTDNGQTGNGLDRF
jgi:hypothetical protein